MPRGNDHSTVANGDAYGYAKTQSRLAQDDVSVGSSNHMQHKQLETEQQFIVFCGCHDFASTGFALKCAQAGLCSSASKKIVSFFALDCNFENFFMDGGIFFSRGYQDIFLLQAHSAWSKKENVLISSNFLPPSIKIFSKLQSSAKKKTHFFSISLMLRTIDNLFVAVGKVNLSFRFLTPQERKCDQSFTSPVQARCRPNDWCTST